MRTVVYLSHRLMQYHLLATSVGLVFVYVVGQGNLNFVYRLARDDGMTHPLLASVVLLMHSH